jgi:hypothetical protein
VKIAAKLAAKELEETLKNKHDNTVLAREAIDSFISWILDLLRLKNELEIEEIANLQNG